MIEVERLALISKEEFDHLGEKILKIGGVDLGENNTESVFFLAKNARVKVQKNTSKNTAKISWKSGSPEIGISSRHDIEVKIDPDDKEQAVELVKKLLGNDVKVIPTAQSRHDYSFPNGVKTAVKYSESYGYHVELDKNVDDEDKQSSAMTEIIAIAKKLDLKLLEEKEEDILIEKALKKYEV